MNGKNEFGDPKKNVMMEDLTRLEREMKILHGHVDNCMEKVDIGNDIARDTQKKLSETNTRVEKIIELLTGNDLDENDNGAIGKIRALESRVTKLERKMDRFFYILVGLSLSTGWALSDIITKFFGK
jgi:hypothetical protein